MSSKRVKSWQTNFWKNMSSKRVKSWQTNFFFHFFNWGYIVEKAVAPHSSTVAWKIPWMEEPGRLQSNGVARSQTQLSDFTCTFHFHALEKEMAIQSSTLAWKIPWMEEPARLQSMGSQRVGHDWVTSLLSYSSRSLLVMHFKYSSVYMSIPNAVQTFKTF